MNVGKLGKLTIIIGGTDRMACGHAVMQVCPCRGSLGVCVSAVGEGTVTLLVLCHHITPPVPISYRAFIATVYCLSPFLGTFDGEE